MFTFTVNILTVLFILFYQKKKEKSFESKFEIDKK